MFITKSLSILLLEFIVSKSLFQLSVGVQWVALGELNLFFTGNL